MTDVSRVIVGGEAPELARAAAEWIKSGVRQSGGRISKRHKPVPGRVMAVIESDRAINTFLVPEMTGPATWISVHRRAGAARFEERERRMVELFHSQSAWLLVQLDSGRGE
jgi:hypothetical protein